MKINARLALQYKDAGFKMYCLKQAIYAQSAYYKLLVCVTIVVYQLITVTMIFILQFVY